MNSGGKHREETMVTLDLPVFLYFLFNDLLAPLLHIRVSHLEGQKAGTIAPSRVLSFILIRWVNGRTYNHPWKGFPSLFLFFFFFPLFLIPEGKFLLQIPGQMAPKESFIACPMYPAIITGKMTTLDLSAYLLPSSCGILAFTQVAIYFHIW